MPVMDIKANSGPQQTLLENVVFLQSIIIYIYLCDIIWAIKKRSGRGSRSSLSRPKRTRFNVGKREILCDVNGSRSLWEYPEAALFVWDNSLRLVNHRITITYSLHVKVSTGFKGVFLMSVASIGVDSRPENTRASLPSFLFPWSWLSWAWRFDSGV